MEKFFFARLRLFHVKRLNRMLIVKQRIRIDQKIMCIFIRQGSFLE